MSLLITEVTVTPIAFPDPPLLNVAGVHQPWALRTIVEVRTDAGVVGIGESYGDQPHLDLMNRAAVGLVGLDAFDLNGLRARVAEAVGVSGNQKTIARVVSPFEVACLDAQGLTLERPVSDLLGGRVRNRVSFSAYLFYKWAAHPGAEPDEWGPALDPAGIVAQARQMIDAYGFESIKLKGGVFEPDAEIAAIRALSEEFGDHPLRLDPNCGWTPATAIRVAEETAGLLEYLEDPTPGIDGMSEVAQAASMPLATNMCVVAFDHIAEAVAKRAVGVILSDHHYWGGLRASAELAAICRTFDIGLSMHSNTHLGISLAAMTHLAAATPNLEYALDTHTPWQGGVDVVTDPLTFRDGALDVPTTPGLGVTLDRDALERMHRDYLDCGIRFRDDTGYMRQFEPGFTRRTASW